jgi:hypothetical protein
MRPNRISIMLIAALTLALVACRESPGPVPPVKEQPSPIQMSEERAIEIAWEALRPSTSSRNMANWKITEARQVAGHEVGTEFGGRPAPGCSGPTPPANEKVESDQTYWLVRWSPRKATPRPGGPSGPTAPPAIPEPTLKGAFYLIQAKSGRIVARKLYCVIY